MARDPGGALPLFRDWTGLDPPGLILRPDATEIRCAFTQDVGTDFAAKEECADPSRCLPGCMVYKHLVWCDKTWVPTETWHWEGEELDWRDWVNAKGRTRRKCAWHSI